MTEEQLQAQCIEWFQHNIPIHKKRLYAVPNGGDRPRRYINGKWVSIEGNKMKATGTTPGVFDMELLLSLGKTLRLELKVGANELSPEQIEFAKLLTELGHEWVLIRTLKEFQMAVYSALNSEL